MVIIISFLVLFIIFAASSFSPPRFPLGGGEDFFFQPSIRSMLRTSGAKLNAFPDTRSACSLRQLALRLAEQRLHHPRPAARIAPPVGIVPLDERLREQRLQLPRAQIARRVVARIHVHERIGARVLKARRARELLDVQIRQRIPRQLAAVELRLVDQLRAVAPQEVQLLEAGRCAETPAMSSSRAPCSAAAIRRPASGGRRASRSLPSPSCRP